MKKETLYLIGGSGFIGKNLVRCLSPFMVLLYSTNI